LRTSSLGYRCWLALVFLGLFLVLAIRPADRMVWAAENSFVVALAVALAIARRNLSLSLSRLACTLLFVFLCLHEVGSHYTYAQVPYDAWVQAAFGTSVQELLGSPRNHYDRLVHLAFGLLLTWPIREVLLQTSPVRGRWSYLLPVALVMAAAMAYEVAEWLAVALVAADGEGARFLGMQGDPWDAQKDMALAALGAMLAMSLAVNLRTDAPAREASVRGHAGTGAIASDPVPSG
jgi:putative membrane protein